MNGDGVHSRDSFGLVRTVSWIGVQMASVASARLWFLGCVTMATCSLTATPQAKAQGGSHVALEKALDAPADVLLEDVKLDDAIEKIAAKTGVRIVIPPEVLAMAPYGPETVVDRVEMRDTPLRRGLMELLAPLGMSVRVLDDRVEVVLLEVLHCLGRPATWEELDLLARIREMRPGINAAQLEGLRTLIEFQTEAADPWAQLAGAIRACGAGTGVESLSRACEGLGWGWCIDGPRIVVSSRDVITRRKLTRPVTIKLSNRPLIEVLQALGEKADVSVRVEPGSFRALSLQVRQNFSLLAVDVPAEQILERLAASTGLGYAIGPEGILFFQPEGVTPASPDAAASTTPVPGRDPYVAKVVVPLGEGRSIEWLIRRSELPADLRGKREEDLRKAFDAIRTKDGAP